MRDEIRVLLVKAERSPKWRRNSSEPWVPLVELLESELDTPAEDIHAAKIQRRSAKKSLWQGRLHRSPPPYGLFFAVDEPCNESMFEAISRDVEDRFLPPSSWADACLVFSSNALIGCVERNGTGLAEWVASAVDLEVATCDSEPGQVNLGKRVDDQVDPATFVRRLSRFVQSGDKKGATGYVSDVFKLDRKEVLCSVAAEPANSAKNRWEGSDIDPEFRYRLAIVGADEWAWNNAAVELMHRMQPPDLMPGFAILCAKSMDTNEWSRFRAFVSESANQAEELIEVLGNGGIDDIRRLAVAENMQPASPAFMGESGAALRVRDTDAGEIVYEVSKSKSRIHDFLTNQLLRWADQEGFEILEGTTSIAMYDALVKRDDKKALLIEVKSSAAPGVIRLAVGQLLDYRRVLLRDGELEDCECVLLLPSNENLSAEMKGLLSQLGFGWAFLGERNSSLVLTIHYPAGTSEEIPKQR